MINESHVFFNVGMPTHTCLYSAINCFYFRVSVFRFLKLILLLSLFYIFRTVKLIEIILCWNKTFFCILVVTCSNHTSVLNRTLPSVVECRFGTVRLLLYLPVIHFVTMCKEIVLVKKTSHIKKKDKIVFF